MGLFSRTRLREGLILLACVVLFGFVAVGPTGLLSWIESEELLLERQSQLRDLEQRRDMLKNRVDQLHPDGADPDLVGELLRQNLNVMHPDEVVITLDAE